MLREKQDAIVVTTSSPAEWCISTERSQGKHRYRFRFESGPYVDIAANDLGTALEAIIIVRGITVSGMYEEKSPAWISFQTINSVRRVIVKKRGQTYVEFEL
jgi:hypothetical protein